MPIFQKNLCCLDMVICHFDNYICNRSIPSIVASLEELDKAKKNIMR